MANIKDVAREAGVSVATVSRVFNDSGLVSEDTRRNVRAVAERLNYWPNGVARSLIMNRTHAIGVLLPDLHGEFFSEVLRGIDLAARREGLHLLISSSHSDSKEVLAALRAMRGRIDGLIVMAPDVDAPGAIQASGVDFPYLLIDPGIGVDSCDTISIANFAGAQAMVRHLQSLGHMRIAMITGPAGNIDAQQRLEGYRSAMGARRGERELEIAGDFSEPSGYAAAEALLALDPRPTAVFAANDYTAIGVMSALNEARLRVPDDIAVTGFDDIAMARYLNPPLTTVRVDAYRLGERAVERLTRPARPRGRREELPTHLVVRRSCGSTIAEGRSSDGPARGH